MTTSATELLLGDLFDVAGFTGFPVTLDMPAIGAVRVRSYAMAQTAFGPTFTAELALDSDLGVQPAGLPFSVLLSGSPAEPIRVRAAMGDDWFVELFGVGLVVRFDPALLIPVDPARQFAEIRADTGVRLTATGIELLDSDVTLSLPPSEIPNTGIVVALEDLRFDLDAVATPEEILELGYGPGFQGLYAERAELRFLPGLVFGESLGLVLTAERVAVSASGVTCRVEAEFELDFSATDILPASEARGTLLGPEWSFGIQRVEAEIFDSVPLHFAATGLVRVPIVDQLCELSFGMQYDAVTDRHRYTAGVRSDSGVVIQTPFGDVTFAAWSLNGAVESDRLELSGDIEDLDIDLAPLQINVGSAFAQIRHDSLSDELRATLTDVVLGPLGTVSLAELVIRQRTVSGAVLREVAVEAAIAWDDVASRLGLPADFPVPRSGEAGRARLTWSKNDVTGQTTLRLTLSAAIQDVDRFWRFVPASLRPELLEARFTLDAEYASVAAFDAASTTVGINGSIGADLKFRLPVFPADAAGIFTITTGGRDGIIEAHLALGVDALGNPSMEMSLSDLVAVEIQLPGLRQPEPPIALSLDHIAFDLAGSTEVEGMLQASGSFTLRPVLPPPSPISTHLRRMLASVGLEELDGEASISLAFKDGRSAVALECRFLDAEIELDVFDTLAGLTHGMGAPSDAVEAKGEIELELEIGFGLTGVRLQLGSVDPAAASDALLFEITSSMHVGELSAEGFLRFTESALVVGLGAVEIPLSIPAFPVTPADLDRVRADPTDPTSGWTSARWQTELTTLSTRITALTGSDAPNDRQALAHAIGQRFIMEQIARIHGLMSTAANEKAFQEGVQLIVGAMALATGRGGVHPDSNVKLRLAAVELVLPLADPRGLAVQGSAGLIGFDDADPLKPLEAVGLTVGISTDQIYFSLESTGTPIPLPDLGRYPGGSVSLSLFTIGYGYTKNSLVVAFAGEVVLPPQLIADADTSRTIGFGVGLPHRTRLGFRLDLIPIPAPIPVIPAFEFSLDMNSPGLPGIAATRVCEPVWDGLQLHVPGVIRAGFKKLAVSPMFGVLPINNVTFDADLSLGDETTGVTLVIDNLVVMGPLGNAAIIPLIANPPDVWIDNLCFNARLAGFGVNFNYRRPLPNFDPMAVFEILGLLADPMMPVDPHGPLANILLVALEDATLTVPPVVLHMFPDLREVNGKPVDILLNVGTAIGVAQAVAAALASAWSTMETAGSDVGTMIERLATHPPDLSVGTLLAALPSELRKFRTGGFLAGFDATVVLLLISPDDARAEFQRRDAATQPTALSTQPLFGPGVVFDADRLADLSLNLTSPAGPGRVFRPSARENDLLRGIEFEAFSETDVAHLPPPRKPMAGIMAGAHVKLPTGQRFRFLGQIFEDGSFGMISALDVAPLRLSVAGIAVEIVLELDARLVLTGRAKRDGGYGSVAAFGHARWKLLPGVAELEIGSGPKPAHVELYSDGRFRAAAAGRLVLFNGSAVVEGSIDLSETHCFVTGHLRYAVAPIELELSCEGRIGPGPHYALGGAGSAKILGHALTAVRGRITEERAEVEGRLDTGQWRVGGTSVPCALALSLRGVVNLRRRTTPEFAFVGEGTVDVFGARIDGRAGLASQAGALQTFVEGALWWQGRRWLEGRIDIGTQLVAIGGRTSFSLDLTPSNLAGIDLARLYFKCDLQGEVRLDAAQGLASFDVRGDWSIGARGAGNEQVFPLAAQRFAHAAQGALEIELIHVRNMGVLPFSDVTIPVPSLTPRTQPPPVRFGQIGTNMAFSWNGTALEIGIPPWVHTRDLTSSETTGALHFGYDLSFQDQTLSLPLSGDFIISLVWRNGRFALKIARGGTVDFWNL
jgi:hypothetical protein